MKKMTIINILYIAGISIMLMSARNTTESATAAGTYGVCGCVPSTNSTAAFELTLNEDGNFHYIDQSSSSKIDITGKWQSEGKSIQLTGFSEELKIHDKWRIDKEGNCIQSRKGLEFVRLCNLSLCK